MTTKTKCAITLLAVAAAGGHLLLPSITLDATTLIFLVIAVLPWLASLVKSLELPGGFKVELRDVKEAGLKVLSEGRVIEGSATLTATSSLSAHGDVLSASDQTVDRLRAVASNDPNLAFVGAGIEIEKRLRALAEQHGIEASRPSPRLLLSELQRKEVVPAAVARGLNDLFFLRNQAAHGAPVTSAAAQWMFGELPDILKTLDQASTAT